MQKEKATMGRARQERRKVVSICESCKSATMDKITSTFSTHFNTMASQKEGGPIGEPKRLKHTLEIGMSDGRGLLVKSASSEIWRDFDLFKWSPLAGPSSSMIFKALTRSYAEPQSVPSSVPIDLEPGTSSLILFVTGWRVRGNPRGPRGSPYWTLQQLRMLCSLSCRKGCAP